MVYLDYAANTPVDKDVLKTFVSSTNKYIANPNSSHDLGLEAKEKIDECSSSIAKYFDIDKESIIYTSGASESNNLVIKGIARMNKNRGRHIIISSIEHSSVVAPVNYLVDNGFEVTVLPIKKNGQVDLEELEHSLRDDTILVSICYVDSELGTIQPIKKIASIVHDNSDALFHTDATQAVGKINVDFKGCDFVTFAPHKFFGLNGFGVLLNINNNKLIPIIHGGKSTTIYRSGTPVTANVIALEKSLEIALNNLNERCIYNSSLKNYLINEFKIFSNVVINSPTNSIPNTLNISLKNMDAKKIVNELNKKGIYLSTTSACSLGSTPSKSVYAITNDLDLAKNSIRISLSHLTTMNDLETFINIFKDLYDKEINNASSKN